MIPMIPVQCRSNLDLRNEVWPTELPALAVGQLIQSKKKMQNGGGPLELEIRRITWKTRTYPGHGPSIHQTYAEVELHLPQGRYQSIAQFELWYDYQTGHMSREFYQRRSEERLAKEREEGTRRSERETALSIELCGRPNEKVTATHRDAFRLLQRLEDILHDLDGTKLAAEIPTYLRGGLDQWNGLLEQFAAFRKEHYDAFPIPNPAAKEPETHEAVEPV